MLQPRLLLCLHGIGTNAGLQRMASLESGMTAKDLSYVRRRYISVEALRRAIAIVGDGTMQARNPAIWGSGTTACASDSKHYGAWDQNLTTQWHVRYGGRGVMIYWHVERNSLCMSAATPQSGYAAQLTKLAGRTWGHVRQIDPSEDAGAAIVVPVVCRQTDGHPSDVIMSGVVNSGQESGHGNIDAIDPRRSFQGMP